MASDKAINGACKAAIAIAFKPHLVVPAAKAVEAVEFYKSAFGAVEVARAAHPKRKAEHETPLLCIELKIGGASFLVCDQADDSDAACASRTPRASRARRVRGAFISALGYAFVAYVFWVHLEAPEVRLALKLASRRAPQAFF